MAKNVLIISDLKELLTSLLAIRPELAPKLRMVTATDVDQALAKMAEESFDAIVLGVGRGEDDKVTHERHKRLQKASPGAKIVLYAMGSIKTPTDATFFFRQFSISYIDKPNLFGLESTKLYDPDS